jgi:hypothetical protein
MGRLFLASPPHHLRAGALRQLNLPGPRLTSNILAHADEFSMNPPGGPAPGTKSRSAPRVNFVRQGTLCARVQTIEGWCAKMSPRNAGRPHLAKRHLLPPPHHLRAGFPNRPARAL